MEHLNLNIKLIVTTNDCSKHLKTQKVYCHAVIFFGEVVGLLIIINSLCCSAYFIFMTDKKCHMKVKGTYYTTLTS